MSDLLIRDMEIPKEGFVEILIRDDGTVQQTGKSYRIGDTDYYTPYVGEMPVIYRALLVPEHGRLGDLDKLVEKIDGIWDCNDMVFKPNDHCCNIPEDCKGCKWVETKNFIRRMVANAPTIIPVSERVSDDIF